MGARMHHDDGVKDFRVGEVAVLGLGRWGGGPVLKTLSSHFPKMTLHGFARSNYDEWKDRTDLPSNVKICHAEDYQCLILDRPEIDRLVIATRQASHYVLAKAALLAGKHVLVEKPITKTAAEAAELVVLAREAKRILAVGYELMFDSELERLHKILSLPPFKEIRALRLRLLNPLARPHQDFDGNVIEDLVPHLLSIVQMLAGKRSLSDLVVETEASKTQATIRFEYDGIQVLLEVDRDYKEKQKTRTVQVLGPETVIDADLLRSEVIIKDQGGHSIDRNDARYPLELLRRHENRSTPLAREFNAFFESVESGLLPRNAAILTEWIPEAIARINQEA